ncbi:hypothetical protein SLEP1_g31246 [Rubroshorea leprosula]|uniref:Uncharacterized protein n=1 Tax=Rubroshorea leprosula TaxID=152421 RepID=A0AAV5K2S9_9ROSI|nr:hypothetical protein SLEP1_g31246 [Rubroshorea leprosula]
MLSTFSFLKLPHFLVTKYLPQLYALYLAGRILLAGQLLHGLPYSHIYHCSTPAI